MEKSRLVAVTGTPGTGKSSVAAEVGRRLGMDVVDLNKEIKERDEFSDVDAGRDAVAVDVEKLVETFQDEWDENVVIESHLSHFFPADVVIVLRCHPDELKGRLSGRGWSAGKVEENLEAEALDMVLQEAVDMNDRVYEVDTTGMSIDASVEAVLSIIDGENEDYEPGQVDWSSTLGGGV